MLMPPLPVQGELIPPTLISLLYLSISVFMTGVKIQPSCTRLAAPVANLLKCSLRLIKSRCPKTPMCLLPQPPLHQAPSSSTFHTTQDPETGGLMLWAAGPSPTPWPRYAPALTLGIPSVDQNSQVQVQYLIHEPLHSPEPYFSHL